MAVTLDLHGDCSVSLILTPMVLEIVIIIQVTLNSAGKLMTIVVI